MNNDILFMALGGGQRIGASCYFLKLGTSFFLLDCGTGYHNGSVFGPDLQPIIQPPFMESFQQINQVFISHAHADHIGFLPKFMKMCKNVPIYMTETTAMLAEYQLYDRNFSYNEKEQHEIEKERLALRQLLEKVIRMSFNKTMSFGDYKITFFPAGHIPGASMIYIEYKNRKILYTGDFSTRRTPFTGGYMLPEGVKPDTLILCGLHAKHSHSYRERDTIHKKISIIKEQISNGVPVYCKVKQLSKGVEFLKMLNDIFGKKSKRKEVKIYLDGQIMQIVQKMENLGIPVLNQNNYSYSSLDTAKAASVVISPKEPTRKQLFEYYTISVDFSLHEDFEQLCEFVRELNPKSAIVVHCAREGPKDIYTIEQELMKDSSSKTQFIFAEEKQIYIL